MDQEYEKIKLRETNRYKLSFPIDCKTIDNQITDLNVRIESLTRNRINNKNSTDEKTLSILQALRIQKKLELARYNCKDKLELEKLRESKEILDVQLKNQDIDVLNKAKKSETLLFVFGGIILLITSAIVLKKQK